MAAPLPLTLSGSCCAPVCSDQSTSNIPGPKGDPGANGTNGNNGISAFTTTTATFTQPAVGSDVSVAVADSRWCVVGEVIFVGVGGYYLCDGKADDTHVTLKNLGYTGNAAPATNVTSPQGVSPGGIKGTDGASGSNTLNNLSPTTTKGDIIVDNGVNSPLASDVRLAVGTDGQALVANATQPTGLKYTTIAPNAAPDNGVPRFDGTSGTPVPIQSSLVILTDEGSFQSTGSGGNARGTKATDLQVDRGANTQVASGNNSFIGGGFGNTASGTNSVVTAGSSNIASAGTASVSGGINNTASGVASAVAGGTGNSATNLEAFVGGGANNLASGSLASVCAGSGNVSSNNDTFVGGGIGNTASGVQSSVLAGASNTASAAYSTVQGGKEALANKYGQVAHASGKFAVAGDAQTSALLFRNATTDATPTELFLDGSTQRAVLGTNTLWGFDGQVIGRTDAGVCAVYGVRGGIKNNAGVCTLVGTPTVDAPVADGGWPGGAAVAIQADAVNLSLQIICTGDVATNVRWLGRITLAEVSY